MRGWIPELCQKLKNYDHGRSPNDVISEREAIEITEYLTHRKNEWRVDYGMKCDREYESAVYLLLTVTLAGYSVKEFQ